MSSTTTATEDRALSLLGQGVAAEIVAAAVGVSVSRISQLVSDPVFAEKVSELRYINLSKHNVRDQRYDELEDKLLDRAETLLPMMFKPGEIYKALQLINQAKRRGAISPESMAGSKEVVSLTMPVTVLQQFNQTLITNINNQVVKAGDQELVTVQSVRMQDLMKAQKAKIIETDRQRIEYVPRTEPIADSGVTQGR